MTNDQWREVMEAHDCSRFGDPCVFCTMNSEFSADKETAHFRAIPFDVPGFYSAEMEPQVKIVRISEENNEDHR